MGNSDHVFTGEKEGFLRLPERLLIAASRSMIDELEAAGHDIGLDDATLLALAADERLPREVLGRAGLLVLEVDPGDPGSLRRLSSVREMRPELPVVAALADASVALVRTLVRQGVSDVVALPFNAEELLQVCYTAAADSVVVEPVRLAPLISVVRAVGGSGATTIATHLGSSLATHSPSGRGACLIDLDVQFGSVAGYLNLSPKRSIADLLDAGNRLDADVLHSVAIEHHPGLAVIASPEDILPLEQIDTDQVLRIIELARREYDFVLVDLPSNWTNWNLSVVLASSSVLMVVEATISCLRQAKRRLQLFSTLGLDASRVGIVLNRVEKRLFRSIGTTDVERALGCDVQGTIHLDANAVASAQDQGLLVSQVMRRSTFSKDIDSLGEQLRGQLVGRGER